MWYAQGKVSYVASRTIAKLASDRTTIWQHPTTYAAANDDEQEKGQWA